MHAEQPAQLPLTRRATITWRTAAPLAPKRLRAAIEFFRNFIEAELLRWRKESGKSDCSTDNTFIQALGFADAGEDRLLAASILDAMSHQASFLGRYREAANMARAARLGTESAGVAILTSHFYAMEARALARLGDATECDRAMGAAIEHFERCTPGDGPAWLDYFDDAELAAELGHCHRDLGRPDRAIDFATRALDSASGDYVRSDFFVAMVLADAHLDRGDVDEGCQVAARAFAVGEGLESARCHSYVTEFRERLALHGRVPSIREFAASVRETRMWSRSERSHGPPMPR